MSIRIRFVCLLAALLLGATAASAKPESYALVGVNVIPMDREMKALADAGLPNYAVPAAATRNAHEYLGSLDRSGTIQKGKQADLVLLEADPLENISNTEKRAGVMLKGKWYTQAEMNRWLDEIAPKFHAVELKDEK